ncbi:MAG: hypothetical protein HOV81_08960 [Kofleriaceae bacterium]|nr:hypothetical protein [Kofleriaceae bacterium]
MRINALYVAIVLVLAGTIPRWWAHADVGSHRIEVGLRSFIEYGGYSAREEPLRELNGKGQGFEQLGLACFLLGIASAIACAIASELVRRRQLGLRTRVALVAPLGGFAVVACAFAVQLSSLRYLDLGRSLWLGLAGSLLGAAALFVPPRATR